tara:strand:+ start:35287 stop:35700 length:414 start_codon:yes stop_codon:yes gene_type:complete
MSGKPTWGLNAKSLLSEKGLKQEDLMETLGVSSKSTVSHYLNGQRSINLEQFLQLCEFLDTDPNTLLGVNTSVNTTQLETVLKHTISSWVTRFAQMDWVEYKQSADVLVDILSNELLKEIGDQPVNDLIDFDKASSE